MSLPGHAQDATGTHRRPCGEDRDTYDDKFVKIGSMYRAAKYAEVMADSETEPVLMQIRKDYYEGRLSLDALRNIYLRFIVMAQANDMPDPDWWWNMILPVSGKALLSYPPLNGPGNTWRGQWPISSGDREPVSSIPVVYALYDSSDVICYVGSTGNLKARLRAHEKCGKRFVRWAARPYFDREVADTVAGKMISDIKPTLNIRGVS